jgi:hypothetical protein
LVVRNTGGRAWDARRVHVSYHWLWLVPRELAKRSRTLPFHDGIRTELAASVLPGADVRVDGRLLAPDFPGLYWLQWDMVEEGVTWFAQVSPRQPRQLVVVLPTLAGFFAPLPLIVALVGALALAPIFRFGFPGKRGTAPFWFVVSADVVWCAASLVSKPLILVHDALLEPTPVAYWLIGAAAIGPPLVAMIVLPRRLRPWVLLGLGAFCSLLILGDTLYYQYFGDVLSVAAMLGARQTGQVSGSIRSLTTPAMLWLVLDLPFALWLAITLTGKSDSVSRFVWPVWRAPSMAASDSTSPKYW